MRRILLMSTALAFAATAAQAADVVDTLKQEDQFNKLVQAIEKAGLQGTLKGEGPFTVFAPTNKAFDQLPQDGLGKLDQQQLKTLLQHHVVQGKEIASDEIPERLEPMAGGQIDVSLGGQEILLYSAPGVDKQSATDIERAKVAQGDIEADNGVIHAISGVLVPQDMEKALKK